MNFGLSDKELQLIQAVFNKHENIDTVKIFGSRALESYKKNSDIDLVCWGKISEKQIAQILGELEELPMPYKFDLTHYSSIKHKELKEQINKHAFNIYRI